MTQCMKPVIENQGYSTKYWFLNSSRVKILIVCCLKINMTFFFFIIWGLKTQLFYHCHFMQMFIWNLEELLLFFFKARMSFICHIHNYTEYNEEWNVFSAFNPSKCTHTWSSGQPTVQRPGSSRGLPVGAGIRTHNLGLPRVSSPTLYPLGQRLP